MQQWGNLWNDSWVSNRQLRNFKLLRWVEPTGRKKTVLILIIYLKENKNTPFTNIQYFSFYSNNHFGKIKPKRHYLAKVFNLIKYQSTLITISLAIAAGMEENANEIIAEKGCQARRAMFLPTVILLQI